MIVEGRMRTIWIAFVFVVAISSIAHAQQCGDPPRVDDQSLKGELEGKAKFLSGWLGDAGLKGQVEAARSDVLSKYPNADQVRADAYLSYVFCTFVLTDAKLSAEEKFRKILEFRQSMSTARK
jgi:hypothetical protein